MDKQRQKQQKGHKNEKNKGKAPHHPKRPAISFQKRNELKALVASLLELCFKPSPNQKEDWEQYIALHGLLRRIMELEMPLRRQALNVTPEARIANIDAFYKWATENGMQYDGVQIAEFPSYDLGLQATRDISKDEELFAIPRKLILSEEHLDQDFNHSKFTSLTNLKLTYTLMLESLKPDSFWKPYIDMLPNQYCTVLYMEPEELKELKGSSALSLALTQCRAIARQYAFIYHCTQQSMSQSDKIRSIGIAFREQFSYDLYRWAVSTVMTRQNMIPPSAPQNENPEMIAALIPFWDMANHREGELTSFYNMETHQMESAAQSNFKKDEQIFIYYGKRSNADLLVHNGFISANNGSDSVAIKLGLSISDALYQERLKLLTLLEISKHSELKVLPAPIYISAELLAFVRVFNMNSEQLEHWITSERATDLLHIDCALETSLESKSWQFLQTRLMLLLRVFPTTLEEDEKELAVSAESGESARNYVSGMMLEYRVLEKRILAAALDYAEQRTKA